MPIAPCYHSPQDNHFQYNRLICMQAKSEQLLIVFNGNPRYIYLYVGIVVVFLHIFHEGRLGQSRVVLTITTDSSIESRKPD